MVIDKAGKVTALEQGGPQRTVDVVMEVLPKGGQPTAEHASASAEVGEVSTNGQAGATQASEAPKAAEGASQVAKEADTAAEVADTAEKIDGHAQLGPTA